MLSISLLRRAIFRTLRKLGVSENQINQDVGIIRKFDTMDIVIRDVTDLFVYREALRLLKKLYEFLKKIPKSEYDTIVQCKKCGKSIPANTAEGWAKRASQLEFKRFLKIAIGSSDELVTHLRMLAIVVPRIALEAEELAEEYKVLSKRLNSLHKNWITGTF